MDIGLHLNTFNIDILSKTIITDDFNKSINSGFKYLYIKWTINKDLVNYINNAPNLNKLSYPKLPDDIVKREEIINKISIGELPILKIGVDTYSVTSALKYSYFVQKEKSQPILVLEFDEDFSQNNLSDYIDFIKNILNCEQFIFVKYIYVNPKNMTLGCYNSILSSIRSTCISKGVKIIGNLFNYDYSDWSRTETIKYTDALIFDYNSNQDNIFKIKSIDSFVDIINNKIKNKQFFIRINNDNINNENEKFFRNIKTSLKFGYKKIIPIIDCCYDNNFISYKYIFEGLREYSIPSVPNRLYSDSEVDSATFKNSNNMMTVVWSKNMTSKQITLLANPNEYIIMKNGSQIKIIDRYSYYNNGYDFLLVRQKINADLLNYNELNDIIFNKRFYEDKHLNSLLDKLPQTYNSTSEDTNLYKLLRSINFDISDAEANIAITRDNAYLLTAHSDAIYKNFGVLAKLNQEKDWNTQKYKAFVSGIIKSLLNGPTLKSIQDAINLFVNYDYELNNGNKIANITVTEAYKEPSSQDTNASKIMAMFTFYVEIELIDENKTLDPELINRDITYIIKILKPAHTLAILQILYSREEWYRNWYEENRYDSSGFNKPFETMDEYALEYTIDTREPNYGLVPYSFITFGEFTIENAKEITNLKHHNIFNGLNKSDIILYGSLTPDSDSGGTVTNASTPVNNNIKINSIGEVGKTNYYSDKLDKNLDLYWNRYPLGLISRIIEETFTIE